MSIYLLFNNYVDKVYQWTFSAIRLPFWYIISNTYYYIITKFKKFSSLSLKKCFEKCFSLSLSIRNEVLRPRNSFFLYFLWCQHSEVNTLVDIKQFTLRFTVNYVAQHYIFADVLLAQDSKICSNETSWKTHRANSINNVFHLSGGSLVLSHSTALGNKI